MGKQKLDNVTLIVVDCNSYGNAVASLNKSMEQCDFASVKFITDIDISVDNIDVIKISSIKSKEEYSEFIIKQLYKYFDTDYVLITQHDAWVLDGKAWDDDFYNYDYIGAAWLYSDGRNIGNGGFSMRSKKLQTAIALDFNINICHPEDEIIGRLYRSYLEDKYGIKFPTDEVADKFAYELREPSCNTFGFHGDFHRPYRPLIVIKRTGAMGDVIMIEPVIDYFYKNGYDVAIDTLLEMMALFFNHPYRIKHISEIDIKRIKPSRVINLDMSYESKPKQSVLKSYYEFAEIKDGLYRNSKLFVNKNSNKWMFEKYVVFHIDDRGMPHRNIYGINWALVEDYFKSNGYLVIQAGNRNNQNIGIHMHTQSKHLLMYLIAGAEVVIGIDSGITQMAVALGIPSLIFTGSVNLNFRYNDFSKIEVIKNKCVKDEFEYCYHNKNSTVTGIECVFDKDFPPCTKFNELQVILGFQKLLNKIKL